MNIQQQTTMHLVFEGHLTKIKQQSIFRANYWSAVVLTVVRGILLKIKQVYFNIFWTMGDNSILDCQYFIDYIQVLT
jgi:hypothetical protein